MKRLFLFTIASLLYTLVVKSQTNDALKWTPELELKVKAPGTPRVSPDGKKIVYTVTSPVMSADKSEFITQIWLASVDGKENLQLTYGDKSSTNPKWSPDGKWIAFTSTRNNNRNNLFLLHLAGGEPLMVTDLKNNMVNYEFSPDGKSIAFTMTDGKSAEEEKNDRGRNDYRWVDENIKLTRLYLISLTDNADKPEPVKLTADPFNVTSFDWSPDNKQIVFGHTKGPGQKYTHTSDISLIQLSDKKISSFATTDVPEVIPSFSPDGKFIGYIAGKFADKTMINDYYMKFQPVAGGQANTMPFSFDGRTAQFGGWLSDGRYYFSEAKNTGTQLYAYDLPSAKLQEIKTPGVTTALTINETGTMMGFVIQSNDRPPEVYVSSAKEINPVQVTHINESFLKMPVGKTEAIRWKSKDGKEIEGLLTYPLNYNPGQKVPLLLIIHGGPNGIFQQTYLGNGDAYPLATFASEGFAILRPNPRGSTGYGTPFRIANVRDWGNGDYQDIMTGVDKLIQMGVADPDKMGVMGWSYGGYMTAWIIGHTNRFKAASAGAAVTNLVSMVSTTDYPQVVNQYMEAEHWNDPAIYQKISPISYVKSVTTPTLFQHGEADVRVPIAQAYEFYYALKSRQVPCRMLVLPRQPHAPNEPKMILITMQSNLEWFRKYLGGVM